MRRKRDTTRFEDQWGVLDIIERRQYSDLKRITRNANENVENLKNSVLLPFTSCLKSMPFLRAQNSIGHSFEKLYHNRLSTLPNLSFRISCNVLLY